MTSAPSVRISISDNAESMGKNLALWLKKAVLRAVQTRGEAWVALSGGTTPAVLYNALMENSRGYAIPWEKVHIYFTDERLVPFDDDLSNGGNAWRQFFSRVTPGPHIHWIVSSDVSRIPDDTSLVVGSILCRCNEQLAIVPRVHGIPLFDAMLLGVGSDGHVASIIPSATVLNTQGYYQAVEGGSPHAVRVSMNLDVIANATNIAFAVKGEGKQEISAAVLEQHYSRLPAVQALERATGTVHWFGDKDSYPTTV